MKQIPFHDFKKEYQANKKAVDAAIKKVLDSGYYILGNEVALFEKKFAQYVGVKHVIGVANGMEALQIALMAFGISKGDEVITTSLSAVATALAIKAVGATPVFVDIDDHYHLDPREVEKKISKKTKAIIPVHLYGQATDMKKIMTLAKKYNLYILEDCAQAHGATYAGKNVGSLGHASAFSFYPTKNLGTYGDGGAIATNDNELAQKMRMMRNYGQSNRYEHPVIGLNSRLDEIHASILSAKLPKLDKLNAKRVTLALRYRKHLASLKAIKLLPERIFARPVYHLFVIETEQRDELQKYLKERGIGTLIHYPIPIHTQKSFTEHNKVVLPRLEKSVGRILSLPCHPYLSLKEVDYICDEIRRFFTS